MKAASVFTRVISGPAKKKITGFVESNLPQETRPQGRILVPTRRQSLTTRILFLVAMFRHLEVAIERAGDRCMPGFIVNYHNNATATVAINVENHFIKVKL